MAEYGRGRYIPGGYSIEGGRGGGGRGGYGGGRGGSFNQEPQDGQSRGGASRGRGDSTQNSEGFGRGRGSNFNQHGTGRGSFNQEPQDGPTQRGGYGGAPPRGDFPQNSDGGRGNFSGGRGSFNQESQDGQSSRGAFSGQNGRGSSNQESQDGRSQRGGYGRGRGDSNQGSEGGRGSYGGGRGGSFYDGRGSQDGRGGYGAAPGGRRNFNQESQDGPSQRGGASRGRGGNSNQDRNYGDQENRGFTQSRTGADAPAGDIGKEGGDRQPERAPANFIPKPRDLDQLYKEDEDSAAAYAQCVDFDDDVVIENSNCEVLRIQNWEEADFDPKLLENVKSRSKYTRPRKIQGAAIPFILDHWDVKAQAETGSGKTAAFLLPILDSCIKAKKSQGPDRFVSELASPFAIIVGPTRELVLQVYEQAMKFANGTGVSIAKAYGQYNINLNHREIRDGCDILIATVGRLKQYVLSEDVFVHKLRYFVLDEADRLMENSFAADIVQITTCHRFPSKDRRVTMLFSATFDDAVMEVADAMLKPEAVFITNKKNDPNKKIKQEFILLDPDKSRLDTLIELLKAEVEKAGGADKIRRTLVFTNTRRSSDMAALFLCQNGIPATSINSDRGQDQREKAMNDFRNHTVSVLVSTDVTARGIDVKHLDHVINFDLPQDAITYVHRIGRTGRICPGFATTFMEGTESILNEIAAMMRKTGPLPEALEKVVNRPGRSGGDAPSNSALTEDVPPPRSSARNNGPTQATPAEDDYPGNDW